MWINLSFDEDLPAADLWETGPPSSSTRGSGERLCRTADLLELLQKVGHEAVEIGIPFSQLFDFLDGVNHCRMVLSPETSADLRKRRMRQRLAQVHRNLAGH